MYCTSYLECRKTGSLLSWFFQIYSSSPTYTCMGCLDKYISQKHTLTHSDYPTTKKQKMDCEGLIDYSCIISPAVPFVCRYSSVFLLHDSKREELAVSQQYFTNVHVSVGKRDGERKKRKTV